jgi:hypothetical protein
MPRASSAQQRAPRWQPSSSAPSSGRWRARVRRWQPGPVKPSAPDNASSARWVRASDRASSGRWYAPGRQPWSPRAARPGGAYQGGSHHRRARIGPVEPRASDISSSARVERASDSASSARVKRARVAAIVERSPSRAGGVRVRLRQLGPVARARGSHRRGLPARTSGGARVRQCQRGPVERARRRAAASFSPE